MNNFSKNQAREIVSLIKKGNTNPFILTIVNSWIGLKIDGSPKTYLDEQSFVQGRHYTFEPTFISPTDVAFTK